MQSVVKNCNKESDYFLTLDCQQLFSLTPLFPLCPSLGQADKKAWVLPPLALAGGSNQHRVTLTQPHPLTTIKTHSSLPVVSGHFWITSGVLSCPPQKASKCE